MIPKPNHVLGGIGRVFIVVGVLVLLFLGYQIYGTSAVTGRHQEALAADLRKSWGVPTTGAPATQTPKPATGQGIAMIKIPKISVDRVVVEGVGVEELKKGPGHYPETALPGQLGNMVISGHRTTYGAPFFRLDELATGDEILIQDGQGTFKYRVSEKKIVAPTDLSVILPSSDARITLTTCNPKYSAKQRLIIVGTLEGAPKA